MPRTSKSFALEAMSTPRRVPQDRLVLGIDPGKSSGWALVRGQQVLGSSHEALRGDHVTARAAYDLASRLIAELHPAMVAYEAMILPRKLQSGYMGMARSRVPIELACEDWGTPWTTVFPSSWRAHFGLGTKQDTETTLRLASLLAKAPVQSHDEADAILLALFASKCLPTPSL